jgi:hypothetical protein
LSCLLLLLEDGEELSSGFPRRVILDPLYIWRWLLTCDMVSPLTSIIFRTSFGVASV